MGTDKEGTRLCKIESKGKAGRNTKIRGERKGRGWGAPKEQQEVHGVWRGGVSASKYGAHSLCQGLEIKVRLQGALG